MDLNRIKQRQQAAKTGDRFKFQDGATNVRLFFFSHVVTEADIKAGFFQKNKLGKKEKECDRAVTIHFMGGEHNRPQLSNPKLMAQYEEVLADKGAEVARKIGPQTKFGVNLVNMDEKPRKMYQPMIPKTVYNKILSKMANPDYMVDGVYGAKLVGCNGRDFVVTYNPNAKGMLKYEVDLREKDLCSVLDVELLKSVKDFYSPEGFASLGIVDNAPKAEEEEETTDDADSTEETAAEEETAEAEETTSEKEETTSRKQKTPAKVGAKGTAKPAEDNAD
jgi:hypothetical protein